MSADLLRKAAALMRERAQQHQRVMHETSPEVHGGPDAHWTPVFLSSAILGHRHVLDDDPEVVQVVTANVEAMAPWADSRISLAVADWLDTAADGWRQELGSTKRALAVARAYLGEAS